ncbi:MAG: peptide chain release factor N(5)-glutamine methyltransferase [Lachnospiraceae bacterium]|nr:peptide chain release factor N(5)-glutamine methyltransferase [Lachnospiraceae bacterium]
MTLRELIKYGEETLKEAGIQEYTSDAKVLAMYVLNIDYTGILMKCNDEVSLEDEKAYKDVICIRSSHYPCQYIVGTQDFMGYTFKVEENVLIPRPETELLVETALELTYSIPKCKTMDMCCGTGCIGISYKLKRLEQGYEDDRVVLVDISPNAIALSEENMFNLGTKCDIIKSDLFEDVDLEKYDLIVSNPPYISTSDIEEIMEDVREYEPRLALDGMDDGLFFYRKIIENLDRYLYDDGIAIFEIGYNQYEDVRGMLIEAGFFDVSCKKDYAGLDRIVIARR